VTLVDPFVAGSVVVRVRPMFNLMLEAVVASNEAVIGRGVTERTETVIVSPGTRFGWNIDGQQVVLGVALPISHDGSETTTGVFAYASWELPFAR
jgi:hypothetical protein